MLVLASNATPNVFDSRYAVVKPSIDTNVSARPLLVFGTYPARADAVGG